MTNAKYAIIDTETSGLFDFKLPADAEGQPRLAQLGMILYDGEKITDKIDILVKPNGWEMSGSALETNGLTTEFLTENGKPCSEALDAYVEAIKGGYIIVAFNAQYDMKIMRGELRRAEREDMFEQTQNICVMRAATPVCKVPRASGKGFKFPKLSEACTHFGLSNDQEHSALADAMAAFQIFLCLKDLDALPEPSVYYAKNPPAKPKESAA